MATLSNRTFFNDGNILTDSYVVGFSSGCNRVVRYDLNLDSGEQASHINVVFGRKNDICIGFGNPIESFTNHLNEGLSFYFAISTDQNAFANAGYADISRGTGKAILTQVGGYTVDDNMQYTVSCDADVLLYPNTKYYFWVFPGFSNRDGGNGIWGWVHWNNTPIEIALSGSIVETYNIYYNANGGFGAPATQIKNQGVDLILSSTTPTRSYYVFQGWATTPSGAVVYQPGSSYTADESATLYAVWQSVGPVFKNYKACICTGGNMKTYKIVVQVDNSN